MYIKCSYKYYISTDYALHHPIVQLLIFLMMPLLEKLHLVAQASNKLPMPKSSLFLEANFVEKVLQTFIYSQTKICTSKMLKVEFK